jgi:quercetin dioxygenase-like cupin family protein
MAHQGKLPKVNRFITTHDTSTGKAIFSTKYADENEMKPLPDNMGFALGYTTETFPVDMNSDKDIPAYGEYLKSPPGLSISTGTVLRHVDFVPGVTCAMHRTVSLDYGIVLEGEMECILDSGEKRIMKRGDVCVQRGTNHAWRNTSDTEWARMVFVLQACQPVEVQKGEKLGENLDELDGQVRAST